MIDKNNLHLSVITHLEKVALFDNERYYDTKTVHMSNMRNIFSLGIKNE